MHSNSEGLSPSLRAQLGVGFNRPLPAPFAFVNGWKGDGANDYFFVPTITVDFPATIEFWIKGTGYFSGGDGIIAFDTDAILKSTLSSGQWRLDTSHPPAANEQSPTLPQGQTSHIVVRNNVWRNGAFWFSGNVTANFNNTKGPMNIGAFAVPGNYLEDPITQLRIYSGYLSDAEVILLYNSGQGNNPINTEQLIAWYSFDRAESELDLWGAEGSPPEWSGGAWGIRDLSGNNNHAMQSGMTNNETLGGRLMSWASL